MDRRVQGEDHAEDDQADDDDGRGVEVCAERNGNPRREGREDKCKERRGPSVRRLAMLASASHQSGRATGSCKPQPTVSHHLKKLRDAGIVGSEREGLWAYYYVKPEALEELSAWLS